MWISRQGREVYKTLRWEEGEEDNLNVIMNKLETYVRPRKNKRIARFKLRERKQKVGENFDNFVKDLKLILMDCDYGNPDDILIDSIIAGVSHSKIQERLLDQGQDLTLAKALDIGRHFEVSQMHLTMIRGEDQKVSSLKDTRHKPHKRNSRKSERKRHQDPNKNPKTNSDQGTCGKCGLEISKAHTDGKCPAKNTICNYCKKPNHWIQVCTKRKRKQVHTLQEAQSDGDNEFDSESEDDLLQIHSLQHKQEKDSDDKWIETVQISDKPATVRIDTGAKCNMIVKTCFDKLNIQCELAKSSRVLRSYSNHKIYPEGAVQLPVKYEGKTIPITFLIIDIDQENVISGDTSEKLGLIARVNLTSDSSESVKQFVDFPELVKTTGTLPGEYCIKLDPDARGVVHPPRRQPAALKPKIVEKLHEMEENGYIVKVEEPTEWVNSMVVSIRKDKIRICIDPKDLNKAILREHHPLKTIEEVVANIPGTKVFSTLEPNQGFYRSSSTRSHHT
ncbi:uncharacterized protein [Haliotis asinina]|uniref:uncharacterized protein n=1 Tax=Haliotis asinina TaxID=109174 RepID=UPI00353225A3